MKIRALWVGKTRNAPLGKAIGDLSSRISHLAPFQIDELRDVRNADDRKRTDQESRRLLQAIRPSDFVIALDTKGKAYTSNGLARFIEKHMTENPKDLVFLIGGPAGLSPEVLDRADLKWSLSTLTFSHDLARTMVMEQIYRALSIIKNLPYAR